MFPPPLKTIIFLHFCALFASVLLFFAFILQFYIAFSLFISIVFLFLSPFFLFLLRFPLFLFPLYFFPIWHLEWIRTSPRINKGKVERLKCLWKHSESKSGSRSGSTNNKQSRFRIRKITSDPQLIEKFIFDG